MAHTKNKPKHWRRMGNKVVHMENHPYETVDADGNKTMHDMKVPKVLTGRQVKYMMGAGGRQAGAPSNLLLNLTKTLTPVTISNVESIEGEVNGVE